jgi:hypothetical protein
MCVLGEGAFGKVYKGWSKKREREVAAKKIQKVFVFEYFAILGLGLGLELDGGKSCPEISTLFPGKMDSKKSG